MDNRLCLTRNTEIYFAVSSYRVLCYEIEKDRFLANWNGSETKSFRVLFLRSK